ncbi:MAG: hypothetical protein ABS81_05055 [Pseudonocardia sp. SCN 72-86]|nr:MAG: hypothetical protein ABS81_05055 [Pseudonocardia sp. SCN 72-86]
MHSGRTTSLPGAAKLTDIESSADHIYLADAGTRTVVVLSNSGGYQGEIELPGNSATPDNSAVATSLATAITPDGRELLVIDTARGELSFLDLGSKTVVSTIKVNDGGGSAIEMGAAGRVAYITNAHDQSIITIDVRGRTVTKTINLGFTPGRAVEVPGGHFVLVPCLNKPTASLVVV